MVHDARQKRNPWRALCRSSAALHLPIIAGKHVTGKRSLCVRMSRPLGRHIAVEEARKRPHSGVKQSGGVGVIQLCDRYATGSQPSRGMDVSLARGMGHYDRRDRYDRRQSPSGIRLPRRDVGQSGVRLVAH